MPRTFGSTAQRAQNRQLRATATTFHTSGSDYRLPHPEVGPASSKMVRRARDLAAKQHIGQTRKVDGEPYIAHPNRVAVLVEKYLGHHPRAKHLIAAAYLHDVVEDSDTTIEALELLFGDLVAGLVKELTSNRQQIQIMGKSAYLEDKLVCMSDWALTIKLADRLDNLSDLDRACPDFAKRYGDQTRSLLERLCAQRALDPVHTKLVDAIRVRLSKLERS